MKPWRTIGWLVLAIVVMASAHLFLDPGAERAVTRFGPRPALAVAAGSPESFTVVSNGQTVIRFEQDGGWRLTVPFAAAVDEGCFRVFVDGVGYTLPDDRYAEAELLKLGRTRGDFVDPARAVRVTAASRTGTNRVEFGFLTPSRDGVYALIDDLPEIFVFPTGVLAAVSRSADSFRSRRLTSVEGVEALDLRRGKGNAVRIVRDGALWKMTVPRPEPVSPEMITGFLSSLEAASAGTFTWPVGVSNEVTEVVSSLLATYGLDGDDSIAVTLRGRSGKDETIRFGSPAGEGVVHSLIQEGRSIASVPAALRDSADRLLRRLENVRPVPYSPEEMTTVSISDGENALLLARDGENWRLDSPVSAPADSAAVRALLERLSALEAEAAAGLRVAVNGAEKPVLCPRAVVFGETGPEGLRSREVLSFAPASVRRLAFTDAGGRVRAVVRDPDRRGWNPEGAEDGKADEEAVDLLLRTLEPLAALKVVRLKPSPAELAGYGLDRPRHVLAIDRREADAVRRNLLLGKETEDGVYATVGASESVFLLSAETVKILTRPLLTDR